MPKEKTLSASMEDYLETVWLIKRRKGVVRVRDIAKARGVALPSVNSALKNLSRSQLVRHARYEFVELTSKGDAAAKKVHDRHLILRAFLTEVLGVDRKTAEEDACKIEHALSSRSLERLTKFMDFIRSCPSEMKFGRVSEVSLRERKTLTKNDEGKRKKV